VLDILHDREGCKILDVCTIPKSHYLKEIKISSTVKFISKKPQTDEAQFLSESAIYKVRCFKSKILVDSPISN